MRRAESNSGVMNFQRGAGLTSSFATLISGRQLVDCQEAICDAIRTRQYAVAIATIKSLCKDTKLDEMRHEGRNIFHMLAEWGREDQDSSSQGDKIDGLFGELVDLVKNSINSTTVLIKLLDSRNSQGDTPLVAAVRAQNDNLGLKFLRWGADDRIAGKDGLRVHKSASSSSQSAPSIQSLASAQGVDLKRVAELMKKQERPQGFAIDSVDTFSGPSVSNASSSFAKDIAGGTGLVKSHPLSQKTRLSAASQRTRQHRSHVGGSGDNEDESATADYLERMHDEYKMEGGGPKSAKSLGAAITGKRTGHTTLSEADESAMESTDDETIGSDDDSDDEHMMRNPNRPRKPREFSEEDNEIHSKTVEEIKRIMKLGESAEDMALLKAIKATLWKKAKSAINEEVAAMSSPPLKSKINTMKAERMFSLATKKYINSIMSDVELTAADMAKRDEERANSPINLDSDSDKDKKSEKKGKGKKDEKGEKVEKDEKKPARKSKSKEELSVTTMSD
jgi:hypothetical protein